MKAMTPPSATLITHLGMQKDMCDVQDFEALTPNLLARTIETVKAGGIIIMLLSTLTSLSQLYSLSMDVHSRFRTESHNTVTGQAHRAQPRPSKSHARANAVCILSLHK